MRSYNDRVRIYILPKLGSVPIVSLRKPHVMKWRDEQATQFAATRVNGNLHCLSSAFSNFTHAAAETMVSAPVVAAQHVVRLDGAMDEARRVPWTSSITLKSRS